MLDIQFIRDNPELVEEKSKQKGYKVDVSKLLEVDKDRKETLNLLESARAERNEHSNSLKNGKPSQEQIKKGIELKEAVLSLEKKLQPLEAEYIEKLKLIPNMPIQDVPVGESEDDNVVVKTVGEIPKFDFEVKNHAQIAEAKGWIDKERATKVAGTRFAYLKGDLVLLWQALVSFGLSQLMNQELITKVVEQNKLKVSDKPFTPVAPPLMIKTDMYDAMDRLEPSDDRYKIEGEELWLQGSAEHVLGSMHADELIDISDLPIRYLGTATSFRKEAGTYGKDMEGIIRMHQFDKLEMVSLSDQDSSYDEHLLMIAIQEHLMQQLGLPYRLLNKCTADIGKPNAHGVDIDVWLPGQDKYRETHTADFMTDYQSRRLKTRYKTSDGIVKLVHNNDATAFSQRPLIGIIENFQTKEGDVLVPEVLKPFMGGRDRI